MHVHSLPHRCRIAIQELADRHWPDNLVLVTHQYGVNQALVVGGRKDTYMYEVAYCGNVELCRENRTGKWRIGTTNKIYKYDYVF